MHGNSGGILDSGRILDLATTEQRATSGWSEAQADCRRVFEENREPMWVVELLDLLEVNRAAVLQYGYSRDELLAMTTGDLEANEEAGRSPPADGKHRRKDGALIDVEVTSFAITFRGRPALLTSVRDVTSRRRTEAETRRIELMLETDMPAPPAPYVSYDREAIHALLNDALIAQEAERRRIARELHAETAQSLASLLVGLRTVEQSRDLGQAKGAVSMVRGLVSTALDGVRGLALGLGPRASRLPPARG